MWHCSVWILLSCCTFTLYPLMGGRLVKEKQWTTNETSIWRWYIHLVIVVITIQAFLEICQEIALKLHCEKAERMYHGQFATRHTFSKKKGQQLCESVKWKQPARTDVRASARLHVGKGFFKTLDELSNDVQNAIACRWMQLQLQWLWKLFPSDFTWICVTGTCLDEKSLTLLCALLGQIFGSELDHWSWKRGRLALTF